MEEKAAVFEPLRALKPVAVCVLPMHHTLLHAFVLPLLLSTLSNFQIHRWQSHHNSMYGTKCVFEAHCKLHEVHDAALQCLVQLKVIVGVSALKSKVSGKEEHPIDLQPCLPAPVKPKVHADPGACQV